MTCSIIRNALVRGRMADIAIRDGIIVAIGPDLPGDTLLDARGGAAIPGLHDHHIHLLATAAQRRSVALDQCTSMEEIARLIHNVAQRQPHDEWVRATGYHERMAGLPDARALDVILPGTPLRIQHQTGGLWILNSAAFQRIGGPPWPDTVECGANGIPTGRIFRGDAWLSERIGRSPPDLASVGRELARYGITGVTDASVSTDPDSATLLAKAVRAGALPVRLRLMSGRAIEAPEDGAFTIGPVKILLDDHNLPPIDHIVATIRRARRWGRNVAGHCVTAGELAVMLAAFEEAGTRRGDRIEHGGIIPNDAIPMLAALGLTVVTQSAFIATRGDRYRALVDPDEQQDLYRCASLLAAGVAVAGSSDAPYAPPDPWLGICAAMKRRNAGGHVLGESERINAQRAIGLYLSPLDDPAAPPRRLTPGASADICVLRAPLPVVLADPDPKWVAATIMGGALRWQAG